MGDTVWVHIGLCLSCEYRYMILSTVFRLVQFFSKELYWNTGTGGSRFLWIPASVLLQSLTSGYSPHTFARMFPFPAQYFCVHLNHREKAHITTPELLPAGRLTCLCAHGWQGSLKTAMCFLDSCCSSSFSRGAEYMPPLFLQSQFSPELQEFPALTVWTQTCFCKCVLFIFTEIE